MCDLEKELVDPYLKGKDHVAGSQNLIKSAGLKKDCTHGYVYLRIWNNTFTDEEEDDEETKEEEKPTPSRMRMRANAKKEKGSHGKDKCGVKYCKGKKCMQEASTAAKQGHGLSKCGVKYCHGKKCQK